MSNKVRVKLGPGWSGKLGEPMAGTIHEAVRCTLCPDFTRRHWDFNAGGRRYVAWSSYHDKTAEEVDSPGTGVQLHGYTGEEASAILEICAQANLKAENLQETFQLGVTARTYGLDRQDLSAIWSVLRRKSK